LIDSYLDGELDLLHNLEIEGHLESCPDCAPVRARASQLRGAIRSEASYFRAPAELDQRARVIARQQQAPHRPRPAILVWRWMAAAAAVLVFTFVSSKIAMNWTGASHDNLVAEQIVAGHIRSLMANHLNDVASSDQHTVKPWFDGKLDFAPPVVDLAQDGFPLVGGRLDYVDGRPVAALVYGLRLHYINVFVWPATGTADSGSSQSREGYNVFHWTKDGMTYWAVSDVAAADMQTFVGLLRK
jgi:anti-sigma factor RsiW